jgi:hypothetical protein
VTVPLMLSGSESPVENRDGCVSAALEERGYLTRSFVRGLSDPLVVGNRVSVCNKVFRTVIQPTN